MHRATGAAFGAGDLVTLYPSYGFLPAAHAVFRLAKTKRLSSSAAALVNRFVGSLPPAGA